MFDYKGIMTNITGLAKATFQMTNRRGGESSGASSLEQKPPRRSAREIFRRHLRLSSSVSEERTTIIAEEAREDGNYGDEQVEQVVVEKKVEKKQILEKKKKMLVKKVEKKEDKKQVEKEKKKKSRVNVPTRDIFASDFVLQSDEDFPGFSPIDSDFETDDEVFEREDPYRSNQRSSMPPPLTGLNPAIPNEYDPIIGIIAVQGVRIPRSQPIDIVPQHKKKLPFFCQGSDLHIMLITEKMYDVFKENIRKNGKARMINWMENLAMMITIPQFCARLIPIEFMDGATYYYDYDTVSFLSKSELVSLLLLCDNEDDVAQSLPALFHQDTPQEMLENNVSFKKLMEHDKIYIRCVDYQAADEMDFEVPFISPAESEQNKRMTLERQLKSDTLDHEEIDRLMNAINQDLEDAEFQNGFDFVHKTTLSLFDERVILPVVN